MKHVKTFKLFESHHETVNTLDMTSVQFKAFLDFIESDESVLNPDDIEFYSEMTGIDDVGKMMDIYNGYGYAHHKWTKSEEIKQEYLKKHNKTWEQVCKEADEE